MTNNSDEKINLLETLPHRPPMLHVDRVVMLSSDTCVTYKNISWAEPCFQGHFPGVPIFPGVLTLEALAQTCAVWLDKNADGLALFYGIDKTVFPKKVLPGDCLYLYAKFVSKEKAFYTFLTKATVDTDVVCEATLTLAVK